MAINYSYSEQSGYHIIRTHVSNIVSEVIKKPVCSTSNYGMNGGFFVSSDYSQPPQSSVSIAHDGVTGNPSTNAKYRGTFFTYIENGLTKAGVARCNSVAELKKDVGYLNFKTLIGGGSLSLPVSEESFKNVHEQEEWNINAGIPVTRRSGLAFKNEAGGVYAYLVVSTGFKTLYNLRNFLKEDLACTNAIFLDGSGSSQMQVFANGSLIQEKGSDPGAGRYIWNMVKLINKS